MDESRLFHASGVPTPNSDPPSLPAPDDVVVEEVDASQNDASTVDTLRDVARPSKANCFSVPTPSIECPNEPICNVECIPGGVPDTSQDKIQSPEKDEGLVNDEKKKICKAKGDIC